MSARRRVAKLLLRHDVRFAGTQCNWTRPHLRWLSTVRFDQPATPAAFDDYLGAVEALVIRRSELERRIAEELPLSSWAQSARRLMYLRSIDTLTAAGLCAEVGDLNRFAHPEQLMSFVGVVLSEHSSGTLHRLRSITKSGSRHARTMLVEPAWHYRQRMEQRGKRRTIIAIARPDTVQPALGLPRQRDDRGVRAGRAAAQRLADPGRLPPRASWPASAARSPPAAPPPRPR
jgi:transposase